MTEKVAVYIATTHGPVRIERILQEPVPLSEVFVGRGIEPLFEISSEYDNFIRPGRPVDKAFGPFGDLSFRMDLSQEIKAGKSWQLAAFVAHGLESLGRLAGPDDPHDRVVVLTGLVNADFKIEIVGHIQEKLDALHQLASETRAAGREFQVIIPKDASLEPPHDVNAKKMSNAMAAFELCTGTNAILPIAKENTKSAYPVIFILLLLAGGTGVYFVNHINKSEPSETRFQAAEIVEKSETGAQIQVLERRPPKGLTCAAVRFSDVEPELIPIELADQFVTHTTLTDSQAELICGLQFRFKAPDPGSSAKAFLVVENGTFVNQQSPSTTKSFKRTLSWIIDLPDFQDQEFRYRVRLETKTGHYEFAHKVIP